MSEYDDLLAQVRAGKGAAPAAGGNEYADLLAQVRGQKPDPAVVQSSLITSSFYKPDDEAQKQKLARDLKSYLGEDWSPSAVDPAEAQRRLRVVENDHVLRNSPKLAQNFLNPEFARIAHDDAGTLGRIEKAWGGRTAKDVAGDVLVTGFKGAVGLPQSFVGLADIFTGGRVGKGLESAGFRFNETQKILDSLYSDPQQQANAAVRSADGIGETLLTALQNPSTIATTVGESIPQMLGGAAIGRGLLSAGGRAVGAGMAGPNLPGWLARAFGDKWAPILAGAAGEGILGAGAAAEQTRGETDDGLLTAKQSLSAIGSGIGTGLFSVAGGAVASKLGLADLDTALVKGGLDQASASTLQKGFVRKITEAGISEGLFEEMPQSAQEQMWQNFALDRPLMDGVGNAAAMGLLAGLATGGAVQGYNSFVQRVGDQALRDQQAERAQQFAAAMAEFSTYAEASLLRQRSVEDAQGYFQSLMDEGRDSVFITPEAFAQSGMAEVIAQAIPSVREQLNSAIQTGHDISLPIAELMAAVPGEQLNQSILPNVSETPGGFTPTTSQEYMQSGRAQELERIVTETLREKEVDDAFVTSQQAVKDAVLSNLNQVGRNTQQVNEGYATLIASYAAVRGAQLGVTPEEFFTKRMLRVTAEGVDGEAFAQGAFSGMSREEFMGSPKITKNSNASDLVPRAYKFLDDVESVPFINGLTAKYHDNGAAVFDGEKVIASYNSGDTLVVDKKYRRRGIAEELVYQWRTKYPAPAVATTRTKTSQAIQEKVWARIQREQQLAQSPTVNAKKAENYTAETIEVDGVTRPTKNSNGKQIAQTEEGLRNFWKWFGSEGMMDSQGRPVVLYHGSKTPENLTQFIPGGTEGSRLTGDAYGVAAYFTTSQNEAGAPVYVGETGAVFPVYVRGNLLNLEAPTQDQLAALTEFARDNLLPSDKARFDAGRDRREFDNVEEARDFFASQRENYKAFGDGMARNEPEAIAEGDKFIVEYTNFDADIEVKTPQDVSALARAVGYDSMASMFDGLVMNKVGGRQWAIMYRPAGNVKSASGNSGQFDPADANILRQGEKNRGSFSPSTNLITLLKDADLSTFLHESAHYFFETDIAIAGELLMQARNGEGLNAGEQQILSDVSALLSWHGIQGVIEEQFAQWSMMDFEEKRSYHERTAESFEKYLFEGKAPSIELQSYFQKFSAWMKSVYQSVKNFLARNPEAGKLNDEVRAVFDRMLATDEQIKIAEQARSMMPLFMAPEQAGWTPEQFAEYQNLGAGATAQAVAELQANGLQDLAWSDRLRLKALRKVKRDAAEARAAMESEARREVLTQDVYRAWAFLTGKLTDDDKLDPVAMPPKSKAGPLDESVDSLFTAIAKLGGLKKAEVIGTWGTDPADKPRAPIFGGHVWRVDGGMSIDGMAEALGQYGYLTLDENGKADLQEFERLFAEELSGNPQYSSNVDPAVFRGPQPNVVANPEGLNAARLSLDGLFEMGVSTEVVNLLKSRKMTAEDGLAPELIAPMFRYETADEMVQALAQAVPPKEAIAALTDKKMLEQFGNLATPEGIEQAADAAVHNEIRARMVATELAALENAVSPRETVTDKSGRQRSVATMPKLAKQYADNLIAKLKIRNVRPGQYAAAETRAAKAAQEALSRNDREQAAVEKRTQLVNLYATKAAHQAQDDVKKGLEYLRRVQKPGKIPAEHHDQIMSLLSKYSLRNESLGELENVKRFRTWAKAQLDAGQIPPDVEMLLTAEQRASFAMEITARNDDGDLIYPNEEDQALLLAEYVDQIPVRNYKDVTVEEFRGLVETIKQIEHIGRRTQKVLTDRKNRLFNDLIAEISQNALEVAERTGRKSKDVRTSNTLAGGIGEMGRGAFFSHVKAAALIEVIDGKQGGPLWEALMLTANEATDSEVMSIAAAHDKVKTLLRDLQKNGDITDRAKFFPTIGRELNRQARIAMAMNMGNESNMQRLLGGEGWTMAQIKPVLDTLTAADWQFVQSMWDLYEEYKPQWVKVYRDLNGAEPEMVEPRPLEVETADGQKINLRGGYAPVVFDPRGSGKAASQSAEKQAKQMMQAARVASTVNKSFTKSRVEEVRGRPLMLSLDALINGLQDTIHYTHWQPWVIDANRIVKALDDSLLREKYGAEAVNVLRDWVADTAAGVHGPRDSAERMIAWAAKNVSFTALAMNVLNAAQQVTGVSSSIVTLGNGGSTGSGYVWFARGLSHVIGNSRQAYTEAVEKSDFLKKRATTMLRDLNETANVVQDQGKYGEFSDKYGYVLTQMMQVTVDLPTWWGAYYKAVAKQDGITVSADGKIDDSRAVALADQAVIDSQGSGLKKDLARYERATGAMRLLAGFMSYMNAMFNQNYRIARSERSVPRKVHDLLLINTMPVVGMVLLKALLVPGGDDEPEDLAKKMATEQVGFLFGQMIGLREISQIAAAVGGDQFAGSYGGPVGLRAASDTLRLAQQVGQGEADLPLLKAAISVAGDIFRLPSVQINRTITGIDAVMEGDTDGPVETAAAPVFGFKRQ